MARGIRPSSGGGETLASQIILSQINRAAVPLTFVPADYGPLLEWIQDRRLVLIGEASHGTHDFYRQRAQITTAD